MVPKLHQRGPIVHEPWHNGGPPPLCFTCVALEAVRSGLVQVTTSGNAINDDGLRVYWVSGDYVHPILLDRQK